jgi:hypothetical protein
MGTALQSATHIRKDSSDFRIEGGFLGIDDRVWVKRICAEFSTVVPILIVKTRAMGWFGR